jgi:repressor LexA
MDKVIPDGYIALLQKTDVLENGEIGAVLINGFDATLKKFFRLTDFMVLEPLSHNPQHQPTTIGRDGPEIKVLGKLLWACKELS